MSISTRIQELREQGNLSQEQLADKLGVSRQAISKWETEQANPDIENIIKLTAIFNVSSDYLLTGVDNVVQMPIEQQNIKKELPMYLQIILMTAGLGAIALIMVFILNFL